MYEKYENTRILRHDLKEQISTLKSLISEDNHEAIKYADKLGRLGRELDFVEYTDNKVLNILLDRKVSECHDKGIELYIKSNGVSVSFLSELDTVAIFSNLINNAMES
jgi:sensor histidine kinase regulating citrate/malate metabolism